MSYLRYAIAIVLVLGLHVAAALLFWPYGDFIMAVGRHLVGHGHDVADIPDLLFAGLAGVGGVLLCVTIGIVYLVERRARW